MTELSYREFESAEAFSRAAFPYLEEREAAHNIFFGITGDVLRYPRRYPGDNLFATVESDGDVRLALMQTPPHNVIISRAECSDALGIAARTLAESQRDIPGILSAPDEAKHFIDAFGRASGRPMQVAARQRIYEATEVTAPTGVTGTFRRAAQRDTELLVDWVVSFEREAMGNDGDLRESIANKVADMVRAEAVGLWSVDGQVVSMAAARGPTPHGIRVSYVYTPPASRGNGYASACTAALTADEFENGRDFCFLFTDLDNPTSNHIYQTIGYRPVCDMNVYEVAE
jgi:hypothetical protein